MSMTIGNRKQILLYFGLVWFGLVWFRYLCVVVHYAVCKLLAYPLWRLEIEAEGGDWLIQLMTFLGGTFHRFSLGCKPQPFSLIVKAYPNMALPNSRAQHFPSNLYPYPDHNHQEATYAHPCYLNCAHVFKNCVMCITRIHQVLVGSDK
jgi:hypothetical protein